MNFRVDLRVCVIILQNLKGSPVNPKLQVQVGIWLTTWHMAFWAQAPGHGFWHLERIQAKFAVQSVLTTHSGRQPS